MNLCLLMKDKETNIQDIKDKVKQFVERRDWSQFHSPKNLAMSISIEAAELMEIFQWCSTEEAWNINDTNEAEHLREEIADVLIYCFSLANQLNIDLSAAIEDKMIKNAKRFPELKDIK